MKPRLVPGSLCSTLMSGGSRSAAEVPSGVAFGSPRASAPSETRAVAANAPRDTSLDDIAIIRSSVNVDVVSRTTDGSFTPRLEGRDAIDSPNLLVLHG